MPGVGYAYLFSLLWRTTACEDQMSSKLQISHDSRGVSARAVSSGFYDGAC